MTGFPANPTDEVLTALVNEFVTSLSLFGRRHAHFSRPDPSVVESLSSSAHPEMDPDIGEYLIGAYCGNRGYMPGAEPERIPEGWRTLRTHKLSRNEFGGVYYRFLEYLPVVARLDPAADPTKFEGATSAVHKQLVAGLTKLLGKPYLKQKQKVEFEWGLTNPTDRGNADSDWGGVRIQTGAQKELKLEGGSSVPWGTAFFEIHLLGKPRS